MTIQDINVDSIEHLKRLHEDSGFDYRFPNLGTPLFPIRRLVEEHGKPVMGAAVKVEAEVYLWMDHRHATPERRFELLNLLQADLIGRSKTIGFDQLYCVLPPEVAKSFGPRLVEHGWLESRPWPRYTLQLRET